MKTEEIMKVGTNVRWHSQGGGSPTIKTGKIVRLVTAEENPYKTALKEYPNHKLMFEGYRLPGKNTNVAYFIEVIAGPRAKPRLYMPFPEKLMKM
jgi:hypothetical protein